MKTIEFKPHPLYPAPGYKRIEKAAELLHCTSLRAAEELERIRSEQIEKEQANAFDFVYIPKIWTVVWSLLDWPYWPQALEEECKQRFGLDKWAFMARMRESLGFSHPVNMVWVSGANRSGKSELTAYMVNAQMAAKPNQFVYPMSTTLGASIDTELQAKLHKYIPRPWVNCGKTGVGYIAYKQQVGFTDATYTFPNGSRCAMKFYSQVADTEGEGFNADGMFPDETIPAGWFEKIGARISSRSGFALLTNTPVSGYTDVVNEFMEGLQVVRWCCGYMIPKDGGPAPIHKVLGLTEPEYAELLAAHAARPVRAARVPECVSEDCWGWIPEIPACKQASTATPTRVGAVTTPACKQASTATPTGVEPMTTAATPTMEWATARRALKDAPSAQEGSRLYECVPRVGKCSDENRAVVWFHGSDNPFGYPRNLAADMAGKDASRIRCRLYGVVVPSQNSVFSSFRRDVHVLPAEMMPKQGTGFWVMDPAPGRNPFILWCRMVGNVRYIVREFPGDYMLPGIGNPGRWAKTSGRKKGVNDGDRAEATASFGWGTAKYKALTAWLEQWVGFTQWASKHGAAPQMWPTTASGDPLWPTEDEMKRWVDSPFEGDSAEPIRRRLMDPRGGGAPHIATEGTSTPLGDYEEMGLRVEPAFSGTVKSGVDAIIKALDYDLASGITPTLYISELCKNLIWAMEVWKDCDGEDSATKDPIDCLRYLFTSECSDSGNAAPVRSGRFAEAVRRQCGVEETKRTVEPSGGVRQERRRRARVC